MRTQPLLAVLALALLAGCQSSSTPSGVEVPDLERFDIGVSTEGRPIEALSLGNGRDVVLYLASIHGSEPAGTELLERFASYLLEFPDELRGRRVVIVPRANPDGLARGRRGNAAAVDLNRDFPSRNQPAKDAGKQPETRALMGLVDRVRPDRIVSIHQPLGCIDWDGPAQDLAAAMGSLELLEVRRLGARPGSLGSWAGEDRGIPVITLELPGGVERQGADRAWHDWGDLLLEALRYRPRL